MALQLKTAPQPEFDESGYCVVCHQMGGMKPGIGLPCEHCPPPPVTQMMDIPGTKLSNSWDAFSKIVHDKLMDRYRKGRSGWDDPEWTVDQIVDALVGHIQKGDPVDLAAFAMFIWHRRGAGNT